MFVEISGLLFLLIIVILMLATGKFDYEIFSELDANAKLLKVHENPKKFRNGIQLVIFEHIIIVSLAITMFLAFGSFSLILGSVWLIARSVEGLMQINSKRKFLTMTNTAEQYSSASESEKEVLRGQALSLLEAKNSIFTSAQLLFSAGTFAYSLAFVLYDLVPIYLGWFGIIASIIYGLGNAIYRMKPEFKAAWDVGGLLIWIFELILGGWLLFYSLFA